MSLAARFVPLPRPERGLSYMPSQFSASYGDTLVLLERELAHLGAKDIVIQAGFAAGQIRNDGWPYGKARPSHPAVIVSFRSTSKGQLSFPCLRYGRWEDNLRGIALSLQALRAVDRYGVTQRAEQYTGWAQLPPGSGATPADRADADEHAAAELIRLSGTTDEATVATLLRDAAAVQVVYRIAARRCHPDTGGRREDWDALQEAKARLDALHARRAGGGR